MTCCSTCGGVLRNGASFCAVCGMSCGAPAKTKRTKQRQGSPNGNFILDLFRITLLACVVLLGMLVLMSAGCWMLL